MGIPPTLPDNRTSQAFIRKSMRVPLKREAVRDASRPAFFELLPGGVYSRTEMAGFDLVTC